ncbi:MerR family transcriptional regulator [Dictyobacter vulcani]|uniref:MerR family transcriptional regulator n=1 Tax=Dictyobacter vulcani TaxID=2607529 RepID=A0A5J4KT65_9CHLR|nr:MerR family transcriptional regulator [Dictyobacter vulcani]GER89607.1 MerR family transcriptional regulator [Dictyobacter vulcani]
MIKIGDFSRLSQVPISTLRYYDELGLLRPAAIDEATGYRFYTLEQLPLLNRILALKWLGLSLDQIAQLLAEKVPVPQIRGMLLMKRLDLQQQVREGEEKLSRVETRLKMLEQDNDMSYDVVLKSIPASMIASRRNLVANFEDWLKFKAETQLIIRQSGLKEIGPWMTLYHHEGYREQDLYVEVAVPVDAALGRKLQQAESPDFTLYELAEENVASVVYPYSKEAVAEVYEAIGLWVYSHGYRYVGSCREVYLQDGEQFREQEEIQFPVEKV